MLRTLMREVDWHKEGDDSFVRLAEDGSRQIPVKDAQAGTQRLYDSLKG